MGWITFEDWDKRKGIVGVGILQRSMMGEWANNFGRSNCQEYKGSEGPKRERGQILVHLNAKWSHLMPLACLAFNLE